jgi:hypothetical protein
MDVMLDVGDSSVLGLVGMGLQMDGLRDSVNNDFDIFRSGVSNDLHNFSTRLTGIQNSTADTLDKTTLYYEKQISNFDTRMTNLADATSSNFSLLSHRMDDFDKYQNRTDKWKSDFEENRMGTDRALLNLANVTGRHNDEIMTSSNNMDRLFMANTKLLSKVDVLEQATASKTMSVTNISTRQLIVSSNLRTGHIELGYGPYYDLDVTDNHGLYMNMPVGSNSRFEMRSGPNKTPSYIFGADGMLVTNGVRTGVSHTATGKNISLNQNCLEQPGFPAAGKICYVNDNLQWTGGVIGGNKVISLDGKVRIGDNMYGLDGDFTPTGGQDGMLRVVNKDNNLTGLGASSLYVSDRVNIGKNISKNDHQINVKTDEPNQKWIAGFDNLGTKVFMAHGEGDGMLIKMNKQNAFNYGFKINDVDDKPVFQVMNHGEVKFRMKNVEVNAGMLLAMYHQATVLFDETNFQGNYVTVPPNFNGALKTLEPVQWKDKTVKSVAVPANNQFLGFTSDNTSSTPTISINGPGFFVDFENKAIIAIKTMNIGGGATSVIKNNNIYNVISSAPSLDLNPTGSSGPIGVYEYPGFEMGADSMTLLNRYEGEQNYGIGVYKVEASSADWQNPPYYAFTYDTKEWKSQVNRYNNEGFYFNGSQTTVSGASSNPVFGEWIQLTLPHAIKLKSFRLQFGNIPQSPRNFMLAGLSNTTWFNLLEVSWNDSELTKEINVSDTKAFTSFRFIIKNTKHNISASINNIKVFGSPLQMPSIVPRPRPPGPIAKPTNLSNIYNIPGYKDFPGNGNKCAFTKKHIVGYNGTFSAEGLKDWCDKKQGCKGVVSEGGGWWEIVDASDSGVPAKPDNTEWCHIR